MKHKEGCLVLDIDDTIVKASPEIIGVYKCWPDGREERLSTEEFAKDPDAKDKGKSAGCWFDYREFNDPEKIRKSIFEGTALINNLAILDSCAEIGWDIVFLTARAQEDVIYEVLSEYLKYKDVDGELHPVGDKLNREYCAAINDKDKKYVGDSDAEKKANVLRRICRDYESVIFVDDDSKNVEYARALGLDNLDVVEASGDLDELEESLKNKRRHRIIEALLNKSEVIDELSNFFSEYVEVDFKYNDTNPAEFEYENSTSSVCIPENLKSNENIDKWFIEWAKKNYDAELVESIGSFLISVLHEIGHNETLFEFEEEEEQEEEEYKSGLDPNDKTDCFTYFDAPTEKAATDWAFEFAEDHKEELVSLKNKLGV